MAERKALLAFDFVINIYCANKREIEFCLAVDCTPAARAVGEGKLSANVALPEPVEDDDKLFSFLLWYQSEVMNCNLLGKFEILITVLSLPAHIVRISLLGAFQSSKFTLALSSPFVPLPHCLLPESRIVRLQTFSARSLISWMIKKLSSRV